MIPLTKLEIKALRKVRESTPLGLPYGEQPCPSKRLYPYSISIRNLHHRGLVALFETSNDESGTRGLAHITESGRALLGGGR